MHSWLESLLLTFVPLFIVIDALGKLNLVIAWVLFLLGNQIINFMGEGGLRAVSNVFNLLLAAIAVTMVIRGLELIGVISLNV